MFYGIEVWGLSRPFHDLIAMILEPISGLLAGVLGVIVLLKDDVFWSLAIILQGILELLLQNLDIEVSIHPTINLTSQSNTIPCHTPQHHQRSSIKLLSSLYQPVTEALSCLFPHLLPTI